MTEQKGLLMVNTGDGKGKTTAALGMMLRAWGHGMRVCMFQMLKSGRVAYGEHLAAAQIGLEIIPLGDGCQWDWDDEAASRKVNLAAWEMVKKVILSGAYDLIVVDELTHLFHFGWLNASAVCDWIAKNKPKALHLLITGRDAPEDLIAIADLVTCMEEVKHPFRDQNLKGQAGIEF
jgi:cob(I)alamin adenosyltransferase